MSNVKERGEIEDTLFFRNSVDKEKFLPELKILLSKRRLKKKKNPGDRKS